MVVSINIKSDLFLTIGVTAYREGNLLKESLNSIVNQSISNWKAVMILDGGCDKLTKKIFDNFKHPKFIKYKFKSNKGPYGSRKKAIELCETEWYLQLDGDDTLPVHVVEQVTDAIKKNENIDYVYGDAMHFNRYKSYVKKGTDNINVLRHNPPFNAQSPFKISLYEKIGGFNPELYTNADWDFWISVFEENAKGIKINSILYNRRLRKNSVGSIGLNHKLLNLEIIINGHPKFFNSQKKIDDAFSHVYMKYSRRMKSKGNREEAYKYALKAMELGNQNHTLKSIVEENDMNFFRFYLRRLARFFSKS